MGVKLTRLKEIIDSVVEVERHPENVEIVIDIELPYATLGARPCVSVYCAGMGFDWEAGQFRITPEEKLMCRKHDAPQDVIPHDGNYYCPKCHHLLSKKYKNSDIHFCSVCGQEVKWE